MILYSIKSFPGAPGHEIAKFDGDFNVEAIYNITADMQGHAVCDCPGWPRKRTCKHIRILNRFAAAGKINTDEFYCYETQTWHRPLAADLLANADQQPQAGEIVSNEQKPEPFQEEHVMEDWRYAARVASVETIPAPPPPTPPSTGFRRRV